MDWMDGLDGLDWILLRSLVQLEHLAVLKSVIISLPPIELHAADVSISGLKSLGLGLWSAWW